MNYDQFATSFPKPEKVTCIGEERAEKPEGEVVLAGTILAATKESCCVNINGAHYEIDPKDVVDIQVITPAEAAEAAKPPAEAAKPPAEAAGKGKGAKGAEEPSEQRRPQIPPIALLKVKRSAILYCRTPVQAALLAAMGTWMRVVPPGAN